MEVAYLLATYNDYKLYVIDNSDINIVYNPNDEETYIKQGKCKGFNQLHLNALYDVMNKTYLDAFVQTAHKANEIEAACNLKNGTKKHQFVQLMLSLMTLPIWALFFILY